ncbi:MAG: 50S ribosomal protein L35 [Candidatus Aureabacteria bacterium]|nr:50S ribosomal protein L35 [Candidatus Auribacterota bacterium]
MPKLKTNKSVSKRFKKTASGLFKRNKTRRRHLMISKNTKQKRQFRKKVIVKQQDAKRLSRLMPYA